MQPPLDQTATKGAKDDVLVTGKVRGLIARTLYNGHKVRALFKTSIRVGSGTNVTWDGTDGAITANGPGAQIAVTDRTTGANYVLWYRDAGEWRFYTNETADVWKINPTTGLLTQPGWTNATFLNTFAQKGTLWGTVGYMQSKPEGRVHVRGALTASLGAGISTDIFQGPLALAPTNFAALYAVSTANGGAPYTVAPCLVYNTGTNFGVQPLVNVPTPASGGYIALGGSWMPGQ